MPQSISFEATWNTENAGQSGDHQFHRLWKQRNLKALDFVVIARGKQCLTSRQKNGLPICVSNGRYPDTAQPDMKSSNKPPRHEAYHGRWESGQGRQSYKTVLSRSATSISVSCSAPIRRGRFSRSEDRYSEA